MELDTEILINSEESMDFTLREHYNERVSFHMEMLNYYLNELKK